MKIEIQQTKAKINETLAVIAAGLTIVYLILRYKKTSVEVPELLFVAAGVIVLGLLIPFVGKWIHIGWYKLAQALGFVMSKVMLTLVFYIFLFPFAMLARLGSKDGLKLKKRTDTYYDERQHTYTPKDMENIW